MTENDANSNLSASTLRRRAEAKLKAAEAQTPARLSPEETQPVLHELQVHQIELELQNEELRRMQAELEASRARYFDLYNLAPVGYITLNEPGLILEANLTAAGLLGVARNALVKQPLTRFILPADQDLYYLHRKRLFEAGAPQACELRLVRPDGSQFWARLEATVSGQAADGVCGCRAVLSDITDRVRSDQERQQAEEVQQESERAKSELLEKLNEAQHLAMIGSWEWNLQTNHVWWSEETYRIFGVTPQEFVPSFEANGKFIYPDDVARYGQSFEHSLQTGEPLNVDLRLVANDGRLKYCQTRGTVVDDDAGKPIRFIGTVMDITERQRMEEALRASEELWRSLVSASPDYIAVHDPEGRFLFLNHYAEGFTEKEVLGSSLYQYLSPGSVEIFRTNMAAALATWTPQHFEHTALGNNAAWRTYEDYLVPMISRNKEINVLVVSRDVTERKEAETTLKGYAARLEAAVAERTQELRDAQAQLVRQEKLAVLGQLAGSVAHELRNPLAVIANAIYFLNAVQPNADAAIVDYLGLIATEVNNADKIVTDLLDFARLKGMAREVVDLATLVDGVLQKHPPAANISVATQYSDRLPPLFVDPRQIEQVLTNLVVNACQAMPEGGTLTLRAEVVSEPLSANPEPSGVALQVVDTGTGISPENMRRLFEPLFTTKAKGIGLGLAVSKKLIEANGGTIAARSELGKSTTFTLYLPVYQKGQPSDGEGPDQTI
jgi:two-component system, cell cycle sensor histidine kinase and response regulator CckA